MPQVRLDMSLEDKDMENLVKLAISHGFTREKPIARWNEWDKKEAVRYSLNNLVKSILQGI